MQQRKCSFTFKEWGEEGEGRTVWLCCTSCDTLWTCWLHKVNHQPLRNRPLQQGLSSCKKCSFSLFIFGLQEIKDFFHRDCICGLRDGSLSHILQERRSLFPYLGCMAAQYIGAKCLRRRNLNKGTEQKDLTGQKQQSGEWVLLCHVSHENMCPHPPHISTLSLICVNSKTQGIEALLRLVRKHNRKRRVKDVRCTSNTHTNMHMPMVVAGGGIDF